MCDFSFIYLCRRGICQNGHVVRTSLILDHLTRGLPKNLARCKFTDLGRLPVPRKHVARCQTKRSFQLRRINQSSIRLSNYPSDMAPLNRPPTWASSRPGDPSISTMISKFRMEPSPLYIGTVGGGDGPGGVTSLASRCWLVHRSRMPFINHPIAR